MKGLLGKKAWFFFSGVLLTLIFTNFAFAQAEKAIVQIRAEVLATNKDALEYTKTVRDVEGISLEGSEAIYYHSVGKLKKITLETFGETYKSTGDLYYNGGELIFAFIKSYQYDSQVGSDPPPKVVHTEEQRFYFADGRLIRLLVGKKELESGTERYAKLKESVVDMSVKLIEADLN